MTITCHVEIGAAAKQIDDLAMAALMAELVCFPKPGLVSLRDSGSHTDMDASTFIASISSLRGYFADMAEAGAHGCDFAALNRIGFSAEENMLAATSGVNTHRGAVFSLGLLAAGAGYSVARDLSLAADAICRQVGRLWGGDMLAMRYQCQGTKGAAVRDRYGVPGAREQAASGFPVLLAHALPAMRKAFKAGLNANWAGVHAFLANVAVLDDTNLLHRGGIDALEFARQQARAALAEGGALTEAGRDLVRKLHGEFVAAWLSPGGSADTLALCYFLHDCERLSGA